jgi:hypothetical protein
MPAVLLTIYHVVFFVKMISLTWALNLLEDMARQMENSDFPHLNSEFLKIHSLRDEKQ